jgi:hypothetical protein
VEVLEEKTVEAYQALLCDVQHLRDQLGKQLTLVCGFHSNISSFHEDLNYSLGRMDEENLQQRLLTLEKKGIVRSITSGFNSRLKHRLAELEKRPQQQIRAAEERSRKAEGTSSKADEAIASLSKKVEEADTAAEAQHRATLSRRIKLYNMLKS